MDGGFQYDSILEDAPFTINVPGSGAYTPRNYSRKYEGLVTLTDALARSTNTIAVKVSEAIGRDLAKEVATQFGIGDALADGPAVALGVSDSSLIEMTGAYAGILNGGQAVTPYGLTELRLMEDQNPLFEQEVGLGERVISERAAQQLTYMMSRVIEDPRGTGRRARIAGREIAGKTGTTQAAKDAWFIGFTAQYVVGVWMGNDDNTPLRGVTGGGLPADIWRETVTRISADLAPEPLNMIRPARPPVVVNKTPTPAPQQNTGQRPPKGNELENAIINVLKNIFGN